MPDPENVGLLSPRLLFVDAYDSFANNIVALLKTSIGATVEVVKIHDRRFYHREEEIFGNYLRGFDAVVVGPGPGDPRCDDDVGFIPLLWKLKSQNILPVLGVCLGFQSLCLAFGAKLKRLKEPRHGLVTNIRAAGISIFNSTTHFSATSYHSLHVDLGHDYQTKGQGPVSAEKFTSPSNACPEIQPLAWDLEDVRNGSVLAAACHINKPFWGVQYHPESICTDVQGSLVVAEWWVEASSWIQLHRRYRASLLLPRVERSLCSRTDLEFPGQDDSEEIAMLAQEYVRKLKMSNLLRHAESVCWSAIQMPRTGVEELCESLSLSQDQIFLLRSGTTPGGNPVNKETGRFSIIGIPVPQQTLHLEYAAGSKYFVAAFCEESGHGPILFGGKEFETHLIIWEFLKHFTEKFRALNGSPNVPFWGGLMGYISYEGGLETIGVQMPRSFINSGSKVKKPDVNFCFIQRSVVIDHLASTIYVQSTRHADSCWMGDTVRRISNLAEKIQDVHDRGLSGIVKYCSKAHYEGYKDDRKIGGLHQNEIQLAQPLCTNQKIKRTGSAITLPDQVTYTEKILACDEYIRAGSSYELCLTTQTKLKLKSSPDKSSPWRLFKSLMKKNAAPFSAYIRLRDLNNNQLSLIGASPERFLCWDRQNYCQFRPIKGTVKKGNGISRESAERTLSSSKERAENLMITDLIRHDLHGVAGAGNVHVTDLFKVEEYSTVYQLVSVIQGSVGCDNAAENVGVRSRSSSVSNCGSDSSSSQPAFTQSVSSEFDQSHKTNYANSSAFASKPSFRSQGNRRMPHNTRLSGVDVLAASLPPGSMTGAPKKRSCELLNEIEGGVPRGIYSGVLGYLDVGGGGDFSVVIRTAYRWEDSDEQNLAAKSNAQTSNDPGRVASADDMWTIGAGGAITAQSDPGAEYEEMITKFQSIAQAFGDEA